MAKIVNKMLRSTLICSFARSVFHKFYCKLTSIKVARFILQEFDGKISEIKWHGCLISILMISFWKLEASISVSWHPWFSANECKSADIFIISCPSLQWWCQIFNNLIIVAVPYCECGENVPALLMPWGFMWATQRCLYIRLYLFCFVFNLSADRPEMRTPFFISTKLVGWGLGVRTLNPS